MHICEPLADLKSIFSMKKKRKVYYEQTSPGGNHDGMICHVRSSYTYYATVELY